MIFECKECKVSVNVSDTGHQGLGVKVKFCPNCGCKNILKPQVLIGFEMQPLVEICEQYIDEAKTGYIDDDLKHYIFETAMETVYGKDVWDYIKERIQ